MYNIAYFAALTHPLAHFKLIKNQEPFIILITACTHTPCIGSINGGTGVAAWAKCTINVTNASALRKHWTLNSYDRVAMLCEGWADWLDSRKPRVHNSIK